MDFDLDADERALQAGVRELVAARATSERLRAAADSDGVDRELWAELAGTGVFALSLPESSDGLGLGATHATVVFEELGRALVSGPLVASHLAAGRVDGAADGTAVVADVDRGAPVVQHLAGADVLVVVDDDGLWQVDPDEVEVRASSRPLDPLTPVGTIVGDLPEGERIGDADAAADWRARRTLLTSALLLGTAVGSTELMVGYAGQREQFGRVIGSFQAVKHLCSDALTRAEVARAAVYAAACHLDGRADGDTDTALATAALLASRAGVRNGATSIQVHGGMGFTWEVDAHLHLKRAHAWASRIGGEHDNAERVAATL